MESSQLVTDGMSDGVKLDKNRSGDRERAARRQQHRWADPVNYSMDRRLQGWSEDGAKGSSHFILQG